MKSLFFLSGLLIVTVLTSGCHRSPENAEAAPHSETASGVTFNPKYGLSIPAETAEFIGLKLVEAEERPVGAELQFSARIYRVAHQGEPAKALASGSLDADLVTQLKVNQAVTLHAGSNHFAGRITGFNQQVATQTGQTEVLVAVEDPELRLRSGDFVSVTVSQPATNHVVSVPRTAVLHTLAGNFVYTANGDSLVRTPVTLGNAARDFVEITDGLFSGDQVVAHPVMTLWMTELHNVNGGDACCLVQKPRE